MRVEMEGDLVIKRAESERDRIRLDREARVLRAAAHPGVVRLASAPSEERLALWRVVGLSLADHAAGDPRDLRSDHPNGGRPDHPNRGRSDPPTGPDRPTSPDRPLGHAGAPPAGGGGGTQGGPGGWPPSGWTAALATTLADLHHLGCFHRAIHADHILFDGDGRPVLCGFGDATFAADGSEADELAARDVADLARTILTARPPGLTSDTTAHLERALHPDRRGRRIGARDLARDLASATVDRPSPDERGPSRHSRPVRRRAVAALAISGLTGATVVWGLAHLSSAAGGPPGTAAVGLAGRSGPYAIVGTGGELAVAGRWSCEPPTPVVLDPATGRLWSFPRWPAPGQATTARPLGRVPGAAAVVAVPAGGACQRLEVERRKAPPLTLSVGAAS